MQRLILFILIVYTLPAYAQQPLFVPPSGIECNGQQYWKLKTLSDAEGKQINNIATPASTTISALLKIKRPAKTRPANSRWLLEKKAVVLQCSIDTSGFEEDGDIHIVIKNSSGQTMVAEIPNPKCNNVKTSPVFTHIQKAFKDYVLLSDSNKKFTGRVEITGVPFFDKIHNGVGAAPTMIEIHPVLTIRKL